jgi:hypothetical protein
VWASLLLVVVPTSTSYDRLKLAVVMTQTGGRLPARSSAPARKGRKRSASGQDLLVSSGHRLGDTRPAAKALASPSVLEGSTVPVTQIQAQADQQRPDDEE